MNFEEVKIVVDNNSGMLFVQYDDGSMSPLRADKNGLVYVDYNRNDD